MKLAKTFFTAETEAAFFHVAFLAATTSFIGALGAAAVRTYSVIGFCSIGITTGLGFSFGFSFSFGTLLVLKLSTLVVVLGVYLFELVASEVVLLFGVAPAVAAFLEDDEISVVVADEVSAVSFEAEVLFESV